MKLWTVAQLNKEEAVKIQKEYELPTIVAMLLQIRGITTSSQIQSFLFDNTEIASPFEIKDMEKACKRIKKSIENGELICVYGDYDADGVTSTALLYSYFDVAGANAMYYIPSRENEGYGMNNNAIDVLNEKGVKLIVTVDNGVSANDTIDYANEKGIDVVVTDHHSISNELPNACAVVDLHREDCNSKFKNICGVGVAFKTIMALEGEYCDTASLLDNYADLLCIGTVGDIVDLHDENRIFVKRGLELIQNSDRVGISALLKQARLDNREIKCENISFGIVPRINAAGRLGQSQKCVSLFLTDSEQDAQEIALELDTDNIQRREIESKIILDIEEKITKNPYIVRQKVIVIDGENWHQGVIGIVAARIKEAYGKPTIILSNDSNIVKGSGRSVEGFSLYDAIISCSDILTKYGGHPMAVGLSLKSEFISLFRKRINEYANSLDKMPVDKLKIDCKLKPEALTVDLVNSLNCLEPYGAGNPQPVFGLFNMEIKNIISLSENKHIKLVLSRNNISVTVLKFFCSTYDFPFNKGDLIDVAVTLGINEYNGKTSVSIIAKDFKLSNDDVENQIKSNRNFEDFCSNNKLSKEQITDILPNRDDFVLVYKYLKSNEISNKAINKILYELKSNLSLGKLRVIFLAMSELELINYCEKINGVSISLKDVSHKVNVEQAKVIAQLRSCLDE